MSHPYLQRHSQRVRLLWVLVVAAVAMAVFLVWTADPAAAHRAALSVSTSCQEDGRWVAEWRITNDQARKTMEISGEDVTDLAPNPTPFSGTSTDSTTHANDVASVTAHVTVDWAQHEPLDYSATAYRPDACETPTPQPPSTTTTVTAEIGTAIQIVRTPPAVPVEATVRFTG